MNQKFCMSTKREASEWRFERQQYAVIEMEHQLSTFKIYEATHYSNYTKMHANRALQLIVPQPLHSHILYFGMCGIDAINWRSTRWSDWPKLHTVLKCIPSLARNAILQVCELKFCGNYTAVRRHIHKHHLYTEYLAVYSSISSLTRGEREMECEVTGNQQHSPFVHALSCYMESKRGW